MSPRYLQMIDGHEEPLVYRLDPGTVLRVGRRPTSDIPFREEIVSRRHCRLEVSGHEVLVTDENSRNGIWISGRRIDEPTVLEPGRQVRLATAGSLLLLENPPYDANGYEGLQYAPPVAACLPGVGGSRKQRLAAVACVRAVLAGLLGGEAERLFDGAERQADGRAGFTEMNLLTRSAFESARADTTTPSYTDDVLQVGMLYAREALQRVFVGLQPMLGRPEVLGAMHDILGDFLAPVVMPAATLAWKDNLLTRMARTVYQEKRFDDLPVLADALEDAGCTEVRLLQHLRSGKPHYRGCWALDALIPGSTPSGSGDSGERTTA